MPVILAILGAFASGVFLWLVWGNGMQVIQAWLEARAQQAKARRDVQAIADARSRAARAPLRAIEDPREAVLVLLTGLALARGEPTAEQRAALLDLAGNRLGLAGQRDNHLALAEFAARSVAQPIEIVADLTPLLHVKLDREQKADLLTMVEQIAGLHGGPSERQAEMIERLQKRLGLQPKADRRDQAEG